VPGIIRPGPWKREVISASLYGATTDDGLDDTAAINQVNAYACGRSQALYNEYTAKVAADTSLPMLLSGPEDRPVLVELRWCMILLGNQWAEFDNTHAVAALLLMPTGRPLLFLS
jgi:hypothetical protein